MIDETRRNEQNLLMKYSLVILWLVCVGCGDSETNTGIDGKKLLVDLDLKELEELCEYRESAIQCSDRIKISCFLSGIDSLEQDPTVDCESIANACISSPDAEMILCDSIKVDCAAFANDFLMSNSQQDSCTLTVREVEACFAESTKALADRAEKISCESSDYDDTRGPACTVTNEKCSLNL